MYGADHAVCGQSRQRVEGHDAIRIGIDVGGTFTDLVVTEGSAEPAVFKVPSTPEDPSIGLVDGQEYWLGSHRFLEERGQETPEVHALLEKMSAAGRSVVVVGNERHVCGMLAVADEVRPEAPAAIAALVEQRVEVLRRLGGKIDGGDVQIAGARLVRPHGLFLVELAGPAPRPARDLGPMVGPWGSSGGGRR